MRSGLLVRHRDSVIASGAKERIRKKKGEGEKWFSVRHRGSKSHIKSFGVIAQRSAIANNHHLPTAPNPARHEANERTCFVLQAVFQMLACHYIGRTLSVIKN